MISAFGIEHAEISKAIGPRKPKSNLVNLADYRKKGSSAKKVGMLADGTIRHPSGLVFRPPTTAVIKPIRTE